MREGSHTGWLRGHARSPHSGTGGATVYLNEKDHIGERHQGPNEAENDHEDADYDAAGIATRNHGHSVNEPAENSRNKHDRRRG